ncbi:hypothetical protein EX30DRAFT_394914 [Ascodesmis nigricans]|uniref:Luciferase domain-containing protein n=1 Tax=Ascodesmis nigricans TaxID=341454 RepID=A0A4S2MZH4_9PEZI|nr:hypothetical protein EX30DRAFT_394914 [Ascodesmis nigricans]
MSSLDPNLTSPPPPTLEDPLFLAPSLIPRIAPTVLTTILLLLPFLAYLAYKDYHVFLSLGPGGTPYNFYGYLKITLLRLIVLRNPHKIVIPLEHQNRGYLTPGALPPRRSPRPAVIGIAPHRQIDQRAPKELFTCLSQRIVFLAVEHPQELRMARSTFEKHCPALFSNRQVNVTKAGEVCHAHGIDGSLHLTLHPQDVERVLEAGWGERHPLARGGWCQRFVPSGFIMVYAPQTLEDVETVVNIVKAAVCWVRNERFFDPEVQAKYVELHSTRPEDIATEVIASRTTVELCCGAPAS